MLEEVTKISDSRLLIRRQAKPRWYYGDASNKLKIATGEVTSLYGMDL